MVYFARVLRGFVGPRDFQPLGGRLGRDWERVLSSVGFVRNRVGSSVSEMTGTVVHQKKALIYLARWSVS